MALPPRARMLAQQQQDRPRVAARLHPQQDIYVCGHTRRARVDVVDLVEMVGEQGFQVAVHVGAAWGNEALLLVVFEGFGRREARQVGDDGHAHFAPLLQAVGGRG